VQKNGYHVERLSEGDYDLIINTDAGVYGGNNGVSIDNASINLPPLTTLWFARRQTKEKTKPRKGTKSTKKKPG
jgi:hypothetical protein